MAVLSAVTGGGGRGRGREEGGGGEGRERSLGGGGGGQRPKGRTASLKCGQVRAVYGMHLQVKTFLSSWPPL